MGISRDTPVPDTGMGQNGGAGPGAKFAGFHYTPKKACGSMLTEKRQHGVGPMKAMVKKKASGRGQKQRLKRLTQ
jgi:hypothetical protein